LTKVTKLSWLYGIVYTTLETLTGNSLTGPTISILIIKFVRTTK